VAPFFIAFRGKNRGKNRGENAEFFVARYRNAVHEEEKKPKNSRKSFVA
jgi:hypothetical protein